MNHSIMHIIGDEEEEDFVSFLANSRLRRHPTTETKDQHEDVNNDGLPSSNIPRADQEHYRIPDMHTAGTVMENQLDPRASTSEVAVDDCPIDPILSSIEVPIFDPPRSESREADWHESSPLEPQFDNSESPLFVPQDENPASSLRSYLEEATRKLLPADLKSSLNADTTSHNSEHPDTLTASSNDKLKGSKKYVPMKDAFADPEYVDSIKQNPYTGGIFAYKGFSKAESKQRLSLSGAGSKSKSTSSSLKAQVKDTGDNKHVRAPLESTVSVQKSVLSSSNPSKKRKRGGLSSTIGATTESPVTSQALPTSAQEELPLREQQDDESTTQQSPHRDTRVDSNSNTSSVREFLSANAQTCKEALEKIGYECAKGSEQWNALKAQVTPDVEYFAQILENQPQLNMEIFKKNVRAWDVNVGVQTLLQKWIMYTLLMECLNQHEVDE